MANIAGISHSEVTVEGAGLRFPGGRYETEYKAKDKRTGHYVDSVTFKEEWYERTDQILEILRALSMTPNEMRFHLSESQKIERLFAAVQSRGWEIKSNLLPEKFVAKSGPIRVEIIPDEITFTGSSPSDIFGEEIDSQKQGRLQLILNLLPKS